MTCNLICGENYYSYIHLMESLSKTRNTATSFTGNETQAKATSYLQKCTRAQADQFQSLQEFDIQVSPISFKKLTVETLVAEILVLVGLVYERDPLGIGKTITQFFSKDVQKHRARIQQRLSLLNYQVESLKFKSFGEIQKQILKEWKKNVLFFSIKIMWVTKIQAHKFTSVQEFISEYIKQVVLIASLSHFYFRDALELIDGKKLTSFIYLQQDTAHKILNSLREWKDIYNQILIPLLKRRNSNRNIVMNMEFDPKTLSINSQYLDTYSGKAQLVETTQKIKDFSNSCSIHSKIQLLREMRTTFVKQITESRELIAQKNQVSTFSTLEKDDIIGCMIYCIEQGQITELHTSIQALSELLGPHNELLSRKGADCYKADLEIAVEFLCQQSETNSKLTETFMEVDQFKGQYANKSTNLQLTELE